MKFCLVLLYKLKMSMLVYYQKIDPFVQHRLEFVLSLLLSIRLPLIYCILLFFKSTEVICFI